VTHARKLTQLDARAALAETAHVRASLAFVFAFAACGGAAPATVDGALPDAAAPDLAPPGLGPPYPIILVHGMAGFRNIGPIDYFYGVPAALKMDGRDVWISRQDPINDSEVRGGEVVDYARMVLAVTGKARVNLVGHSQGGFDARYAASVLGDRVASVTTVGSPMLGTPLADLAAGAGPNAQQAIDALLNLYGAINGYDSDAQAQIANMTADGARAFFTAHPDDPRVAYFSIAGRTAGSDGGLDCVQEDRPQWISKYDGTLDAVDPLLSVPSGLLDQLNPRPVHDGLVPVRSARHGRFLGCVPADHMQEVNQFLGTPPGNGYDAIQMYRDLATFLAAQGF